MSATVTPAPVKVVKKVKAAPTGPVFKSSMIIEALRKLNEKTGLCT
jgi:hypothetical protein